MSNNILEGIIKEKDYTFKKFLFKIVKDYNLTIEELLLLVYFLNQNVPILDINDINNITYLDNSKILESFTSLTSKKLIVTNIIKDANGKVSEIIDLNNIYKAMVSEINSNIKVQVEHNIFEIFEKEFGRPLSPIELEIINAWLKSGINEELILGALKEATYNGVSNLRYIDKIIYEWGKKGFKNIADVNKYLQKRNDSNSPKDKELFDYNWLEDEE